MKWVLVVFCVSALCCSFIYTQSKSCNDCLILTPYIKRNPGTARWLSKVKSKEFFGLRSHSGFITVKASYNSNLFFWFFPTNNKLSTTPWIIWLSGGPGYSSMAGLFNGIGPLKVEDGEVKLKNVTWASDYSLLFIDNPVGAGFSFTDNTCFGFLDNADEVGRQLLVFVRQFLKMFPELQTAPLFIAGQSYAGKYVPALGIHIHKYTTSNNRVRHRTKINLRGLSIGNGLIEMRNMMHYSELCETLGIMEDDAIDTLRNYEADTIRFIDQGRMIDASNKFNHTIEFIKKKSGVSVYNYNDDPSSGVPALEPYVNQQSVRKLIHVGDAKFNLNNQRVYKKMLPDISNTTKPWIEELLEHYGVMLYSGQLDIILAYSLSKHMSATLKWSGRAKFDQAKRKKIYTHRKGPAGYKKSGGNLVEALIRDAGHSVPADQPEAAKLLIDDFINEFK